MRKQWNLYKPEAWVPMQMPRSVHGRKLRKVEELMSIISMPK